MQSIRPSRPATGFRLVSDVEDWPGPGPGGPMGQEGLWARELATC